MNKESLVSELKKSGFNYDEIIEIQKAINNVKYSQIQKMKETFNKRKNAGLIIGRPSYKPNKTFKIIATFQDLGLISLEMSIFILNISRSLFYKYKKIVGVDKNAYEKFYKKPNEWQIEFYKKNIDKTITEFIEKAKPKLNIHYKEDLISEIRVATFLKISNLLEYDYAFKRMVFDSGYEALRTIYEEVKETRLTGNKKYNMEILGNREEQR